MDRRRQFVFQENLLFAGPEAPEHQDRLAYPSLANLHAFARRSHAKPVGAVLLQGFGGLRAAVAVTIAFDDAQHFARRLALLRSGVDVIANRLKVFGKGGKRNLRPDGAADKISGIYFHAGHETSWRF